MDALWALALAAASYVADAHLPSTYGTTWAELQTALQALAPNAAKPSHAVVEMAEAALRRAASRASSAAPSASAARQTDATPDEHELPFVPAGRFTTTAKRGELPPPDWEPSAQDRDAAVGEALHEIVALLESLRYQSIVKDDVPRCDWCGEPWDGTHTRTNGDGCEIGGVLAIARSALARLAPPQRAPAEPGDVTD